MSRLLARLIVRWLWPEISAAFHQERFKLDRITTDRLVEAGLPRDRSRDV